jgi:arsenite/tail-anchored protein-transporting ATPase
MPLSAGQRIVFVTGKGGVGKSTVAAVLARVEADRTGQALLVEFEGSASAARALGSDGQGVRHLTIDYSDALVQVLSQVMKSRVLARMLASHRAVKRLVRAVPALRELALLDRVRAVAAERPGVRVIVDLPATGHGLDWLRVPAAAERFLRAGPAADLCRELREAILTPARSAIVVVSTVEPVVASETRQLCMRLHAELGRTPSLLVANRIPSSPTSAELSSLERAARRDPAWRPLQARAREDHENARLTEAALGELRAVAGARVVRIPEQHADPRPRDVRGAFEGVL